MECGRIVDIGRHEELLGRCELYTRLYIMQFRAPDQWFWMHNRWKTKRVMDD